MDNKLKELNKYIRKNDVNTALCGLLYEYIVCDNFTIINTSIAKNILNQFSSIYVLKQCNKLRTEKKDAEKGQKYIDSLVFGSPKAKHRNNKKYNNKNVSKQVVAR